MIEELDPQKTDKPWGYELLIARTAIYVGKILHVNAGHALSLQYHEEKDETIYLHAGKAFLHHGDSSAGLVSRELVPGTSIHIPPGTLHRLEAITDCDFFEVSTPHLEDVVRLEDRYGRVSSAPTP